MTISLHQQNTINKMSIEELLELNSFVVKRIKEERTRASRQAKRGLFAGTKVSFTDNDGNTLTGQVIKTMRKFAKVDTGSATWRVPMHALTKEK